MTVYADSVFYTDTYLGYGAPSVPVDQFDLYAQKASAYIRRYTFGNIGDAVPDAVKYCCCELAETLYRFSAGRQEEGIASEKVGDVTVSYAGADSRRQALQSTVKSVVYAWLADTGLLYRGGRLC